MSELAIPSGACYVVPSRTRGEGTRRGDGWEIYRVLAIALGLTLGSGALFPIQSIRIGLAM